MAREMRFGVIADGDEVLRVYQDLATAEGAQAAVLLAASLALRREMETLVSIAIAESVDEVCASAEAEAVYIALAVGPREEAARQALEAGKHVLLGGPWNAPLAQGQALCSLAEERGLALGIAAPWAVDSAHMEARTLIRAGLLGSLLSWRDDLLRPQPMDDALRQALRPLALFAWLSGLEVEQVYAQQAPSAEGVELMAMLVRYAGGCLGTLQVGRGIPGGPGMHPQGMRVIGALGQLDLSEEPMMYRTRSSEDAPAHSWRRMQPAGPRGNRSQVLSQFAARVLAGQAPPLPASSALEPLRILETAQRSLEEGQPAPVMH